LTLGSHADDEFSEVAAFQHADEGVGRILQTIDDVFPIADAAICDAGADLAQEVRTTWRAIFSVMSISPCLRSDARGTAIDIHALVAR